jgi:hypothetical protein
MNFLYIIPLLFSFANSEDVNNTIVIENPILEPKEYYLIILGILVGTLIFLCIAFSFFFFKKRNYNHIRNNINEKHNPIYPRYDIRGSFYDYPFTKNPLRHDNNHLYGNHNTCNTCNTINNCNYNSRNYIPDMHNNIIYTSTNDFEEEKNVITQALYSVPKKTESDTSCLEGFGDEYLEINNKPPSLKRRVSTSDILERKKSIDKKENENEKVFANIDKIGKNKTNLMDELRKSLPKLIPKNMLEK